MSALAVNVLLFLAAVACVVLAFTVANGSPVVAFFSGMALGANLVTLIRTGRRMTGLAHLSAPEIVLLVIALVGLVLFAHD